MRSRHRPAIWRATACRWTRPTSPAIRPTRRLPPKRSIACSTPCAATKAVHFCFGNYGGQTIQAGTWRALVAFLNELHADHLVLELAHRPPSDLEALADLRADIGIGIGVVDIKVNHVETADEIAAAIDRAERALGAGRVRYVHPDCGFWMLKRSVADRKIAALVEGPRSVSWALNPTAANAWESVMPARREVHARAVRACSCCRRAPAFPFRYGIASMTDVPQVFVRAQISVGRPQPGGPGRRRPAAEVVHEESIDDVRAGSAGDAGGDPPRHGRGGRNRTHSRSRSSISGASSIGSRRRGRRRAGWPRCSRILASAWSSARCSMPCAARSASRCIASCAAERSPCDLGAIYAELGAMPVGELLPGEPLGACDVRHTVGLGDPLTAADVTPEERVDDGLPQDLESSIRAYGLRYFKIKLTGKGRDRPAAPGTDRRAARSRGGRRLAGDARRQREFPRLPRVSRLLGRGARLAGAAPALVARARRRTAGPPRPGAGRRGRAGARRVVRASTAHRRRIRRRRRRRAACARARLRRRQPQELQGHRQGPRQRGAAARQAAFRRGRRADRRGPRQPRPRGPSPGSRDDGAAWRHARRAQRPSLLSRPEHVSERLAGGGARRPWRSVSPSRAGICPRCASPQDASIWARSTPRRSASRRCSIRRCSSAGRESPGALRRRPSRTRTLATASRSSCTHADRRRQGDRLLPRAATS